VTRLVLCTICIICLICHRHRRVQACYVSVILVSCPAARFHAPCVSMCMPICTRYVCGSAGTSLSRQRGTSTHCMHTAAWALPRTVCMRQRGHFHALNACGSADTFTLKAARRHLGMSAATGLPDCTRVRACWSLFEFVGVCVESGGLSRAVRVPAVLRSCGPAVLRSCGCVLCCHAVSDACGTTWHHLCQPLCQPLR